jgi:hypothetical protein
MEQWRKTDRLICTELTANITKSPDNPLVVSDLVSGAIISQLSETETHYEVSLPCGRRGFVQKEGCKPFSAWVNEVEATPESITRTASRFMGLPYLWGGTSSKALDCSGFTKMVYFLNGYVLERDASQQIRHGERITAENNFASLQPGDLLFYGTRNPLRVVHVGIWMGDTEVIHASGIVKQESMDPDRHNFSDYLHNTFLQEVRRITGVKLSKGIVSVKEHPWY